MYMYNVGFSSHLYTKVHVVSTVYYGCAITYVFNVWYHVWNKLIQCSEIIIIN